MVFDTLLWIIEIIGIVSFATSASLVAIDKEMDLFGVLLLSVVTCFGGGVIRDLILGTNPPLFFGELLYLVAVCAVTSLFVFILASTFKRLYVKEEAFVMRINNYIDALGLGAFSVSGVKISLQICPEGGPFLAICMGFISSVGGGIIRDLCLMDIPFVFRKHIYAVAATAGAAVYYLFDAVIFQGQTIGQIMGSILGILCVFIIRVLAITFKLNFPKAIKFSEMDRNK